MAERARPPDDISPREFFVEWLPRSVAADLERSAQLGATCAVLVFELIGDGGGVFTVELREGVVSGAEGELQLADLRIQVDLET
jgi:hypothetical protein